MTKSEFKKAMLRGLGRCIIELDENNDIEKYRDIVLWGCLHNLSYDTQCEGTRSEYMYVLQSKFEDTFFEDKIIDKFSCLRTKNSWLFDHYANMLYCFALDGSNKSHKALYTKYNKMYDVIISSKQYSKSYELYIQFEWLCIWLVYLDGMSEFKKIVSDIGRVYRENPNFLEHFTFDWFYAASKSNCGEKRITNYLNKNINLSDDVRLFSDSIQVDAEYTPTRKTEDKVTVNDIVEASKEEWNKCRMRIVKFSYKSSDEERLELANIVLIETCENTKANMLWAFRIKGFPLEPDILIEYTKSENEYLVDIAFDILAITKNDKVRNYALELIKDNKYIEESLSILFMNYRMEDADLIYSILKKTNTRYDDGKWHRMYIDAIKWIERDKRIPDVIIIYLYENTLCSSCREDIVRVMCKRKLLNDQLLKECMFDSNPDIRKFAKMKYANKKP
jgi:hypothetical protein